MVEVCAYLLFPVPGIAIGIFGVFGNQHLPVLLHVLTILYTGEECPQPVVQPRQPFVLRAYLRVQACEIVYVVTRLYAAG